MKSNTIRLITGVKEILRRERTMSKQKKKDDANTEDIFEKFEQEEEAIRLDDMQYDEHGKLIKKITPEDRYFIHRDEETLEKIKSEKEQQLLEEQRKSHFMKCPKCGIDMEPVKYRKIIIDRCTGCKGIWIDQSQLHIIHSKSPVIFKALMKKFLDTFEEKEDNP